MTKRHDEPEVEPLPADTPRPDHPIVHPDPPRPDHPIADGPRRRPKDYPPGDPIPTPTEDPPTTTRVLLTGDNRDAVTEYYVPTAEFGFRIKVNGQWFEHVAEAADSGTWIYAPTR